MNTRRQAKTSSKYCKSEGSMTYLSPPSTLSFAYHIESQTSKGCPIDNIKPQLKSEEPPSNHKIIWEEDYNQLMDLYKKISTSSQSKAEAINAIFSQLTQFGAAELLLKSQAPLWTTSKDNQILQSFCQTIVSLSSLNFKCALIEKGSQKYLAIQTSDVKKEFKLLTAEPLALQFFQKRQEFLTQFKHKCLGQQAHKLSELSTEIIFLYYQYHRLRQHILDKINLKCSSEEEHQADYEETLKQLIKQLKLLKKTRKNQ